MRGADARRLRRDLGLNLRTLARSSGVSEARLCRWELHEDGLGEVGQRRVVLRLRVLAAESRKQEALARYAEQVVLGGKR